MNIEIKATFTGTEEDKSLFTPKEWQVLLRHCEGWTKKMIADYACRSPETIKKQEASIRDKTNSHSMIEVVLKVIAKGIVKVTTLCLIGTLTINFITNQDNQTIRRSPRVVRVNGSRINFRDFLV